MRSLVRGLQQLGNFAAQAKNAETVQKKRCPGNPFRNSQPPSSIRIGRPAIRNGETENSWRSLIMPSLSDRRHPAFTHRKRDLEASDWFDEELEYYRSLRK